MSKKKNREIVDIFIKLRDTEVNNEDKFDVISDELITVKLEDLLKLKADIETLKQLIINPNESNFIEVAMRTENIKQKLGLLVNTYGNINEIEIR